MRRSPEALLTFSIAFSLVDFILLYSAAVNEGVLHIDEGVGLLSNYGLLSTIVGNAISLYVARKYYDSVCSIRTSKALLNREVIKPSLSTLRVMIRMEGQYGFLIYGLITIGAILWAWNAGVHVFGNPEIQWGQKVFDSVNHPLSFSLSRLHNFYTWMIIMPFVIHVMFFSSVQLSRALTLASREGALTYDLLNPDQRGGFGFFDRAHIAFNVVAALVYVQITLHIVTFEKMNAQHVIAYVILTVLLIGINKMFLGGIYAKIKALRFASLNKVKDDVLNGNELNFEILKYSYEQKIKTSSIVNFLVKAGAIAIPGIVKFWSIITKAFIGA